jgi:hypothetical protein
MFGVLCALSVGVGAVWGDSASRASKSVQSPEGEFSIRQALAPPSPDDVLRNSADFYRKLRSFEVDYSFGVQYGSKGRKRCRFAAMRIYGQLPNRVSVRSIDERERLSLISDGNTIQLNSPGKSSTSPAPRAMQELAVNPKVVEWQADTGRNPFLQLLTMDPYQRLIERVKSLTYVATEQLDGEQMHHLRIARESTIDLWIAAKAPPVVRQLSIGRQIEAEEGDEADKIAFLHVYKNWVTDGEPPRDAFRFDEPIIEKNEVTEQEIITEQEIKRLRARAKTMLGPVRKRMDFRIRELEKQLMNKSSQRNSRDDDASKVGLPGS